MNAILHSPYRLTIEFYGWGRTYVRVLFAGIFQRTAFYLVCRRMRSCGVFFLLGSKRKSINSPRGVNYTDWESGCVWSGWLLHGCLASCRRIVRFVVWCDDEICGGGFVYYCVFNTAHLPRSRALSQIRMNNTDVFYRHRPTLVFNCNFAIKMNMCV